MYRARNSFLLVLLVLLACLALFTHGSRAQGAPIVINEILVGNVGTTLDTDYTNFSGWIELRNTTNSAINLAKYRFVSLRDGATIPDTYVISNRLTLPANGRLILWADEKKKGPHLPFEMDMDGGELSLFNPAGNLVTTLVYFKQAPDVSYGRFPENSDTWAYFDQPTPGAANNTPAFANNKNTFAAQPQFSVPGGLHNGSLSVILSSSDAGATIRYTTDGSRPTAASTEYAGPIPVNANTVIRARAWADGKMVSPTVTQTYLLNIPTNLPVISLVLDPPYLWNAQIGLYVKGTNGLKDCRGTANWHQKWERPGNIEFYETTGQGRVNQEIGVEISGNCTRNFPQKSFEIKARKHYGDNNMSYAFFSDKPMNSYKRLILRNGGNDNFRAFMRDPLAHNIAAGRMDVDRQAYRPAVVYLNGEYWGIYNMREKMDEDYVENNYDLDEDEFDMLEKNFRVLNGSDAAFKNFYNYVMKNNPAQPAVYAEIQSRMDIDSFIDYYAMETYFANHDWGRNNVRYWDDYAGNYSWRWVLQDLDLGFLEKNLKRDSISTAFGTGNPTFRIARRLWENPDFRDLFIQRYAVHLNTTFAPDRVIGIIDTMADGIRAEMPAHTARWERPASPAKWEEEVQIVRNMAAQRPNYVREHLRKRAGNKPDSTLTINSQGDGRVLVSGVEVPNGYSGPHFRGVPMTLTAMPNSGAAFSHWLETGDTSPTITIPFAGDTTRTAVFGSAPPPPPIVINELHYHPDEALDPEGDVFEFIELVNTGPSTVDLSGFSITSGIVYTFPNGSSIASGEYIILAKTGATYSGNGYQVFQWTDGNLGNGGELVALTDSFGQLIDEVDYLDDPPWPNGAGSADGHGPSLSLLDPALVNDEPTNWDNSREVNGTPGAENFPPLLVPPVVINELHYNPTGGAAEFIELFNNGPDPVALDDFTMVGVDFTFPANTNLPAGGYLVIAAPGNSIPGALAWTSGDLDDAGETIVLKDGGDLEVDSVAYGSADPWPAAPAGTGPTLSLGNPGLDNTLGASWGSSREIDGTPGAKNFPPLPIVINEIHYNPADSQGDDEFYEFVELVNTGTETVDLSSYQMASGIEFVFPGGASIEPGEFIVLAQTGSIYADQGYDVYQWTGGGLSNGGETLALADPFGNLVDSVAFSDNSSNPDWPAAPDGTGPSLSLRHPVLDNNLAANWAASTAGGGTPGAANDVP